MENGIELYEVVTINLTKAGYYIFKEFKNGCPKFNGNTCLINYKVYKSRYAAERTANKIRSYYAKNDNVVTAVISNTDTAKLGKDGYITCQEMENLVFSKINNNNLEVAATLKIRQNEK